MEKTRKSGERGRKRKQPLQLDITRQENGEGKLARKRRICVLDHRRMFTWLLSVIVIVVAAVALLLPESLRFHLFGRRAIETSRGNKGNK